jgi:tetratricopeptide (TPR) repeat protein
MNTDPPQDQFNKVINLYNSGQTSQVIRTCNKLLKTYKKSLAVLNLLGAALQAKGKLKEAARIYSQMAQIKPDYADAHYNYALASQILGRFDNAIVGYKKAIQLKPDYVNAHNNLGFIFQNLRQLDNAISSYKKAIQFKPDYAEAYNNLGITFQNIDKTDKAIKNYEKAIQLKPDYAEAYNNLGITFQNIGQSAKAIKNYKKAIQINPNYAKAYFHLGALETYKPNDSKIEFMKNMLNDSSFGISDKAYLCFALAKAYEDLDEYDKSFNYLNQGNRLRKKELNYDINYDKKLTSKIKSIFSIKNLGVDIQDNKDTSIRPIFIVGMPRSGTSLVEQIIASHAKVHGAGELETMTRIVKPIISNLNNSALSKNNIQSIHDEYLGALTTLNVSENIITDKMPRNFQWVGFILSAFPNAKIIHLNRNPIAVCWSNYKHYFSSSGNGYAYNLNDLEEFYGLYADLMSFWNERFPDNIYNFCYEDLVENQESETRKLLKFCDLEWDEQCLNFHKTKRIVKTASSLQVRKKIYKGSSEAWKKYEKHLFPLMQNSK